MDLFVNLWTQGLCNQHHTSHTKGGMEYERIASWQGVYLECLRGSLVLGLAPQAGSQSRT